MYLFLGYNPHVIGNHDHATGYKVAAAFAPLFPSVFVYWEWNWDIKEISMHVLPHLHL
jgi:hypothetical protein